MIGQIVFNSGGLGAKWNVSEKLGMKLAILPLHSQETDLFIKLIIMRANIKLFNL